MIEKVLQFALNGHKTTLYLIPWKASMNAKEENGSGQIILYQVNLFESHNVNSIEFVFLRTLI